MADMTVTLCETCHARPADVIPRGRPPICARCLRLAVVLVYGEDSAANVAQFLGLVRTHAIGGAQ